MNTFDPSTPSAGYVLVHDVSDYKGRELLVGHRVQHNDGKIGTVVSVSATRVRVKFDDGESTTCRGNQVEIIR